MAIINQKEFLTKYRNKEKFEACGLEWKELESIATDYAGFRRDLESTGNYIADLLRQIAAVHSLKIRVKDPEHLIEKIIRKKANNPAFEISLENYRTKMTDLIGIRALHLFKEEWINIHEFIMKNWELNEIPTANIRKGDAESFKNEFAARGCEINEHKFGYRSVHYLVKSQPTKDTHIAEIQVRTIFEEGWSEIDHRIRYPYDVGNELLNQYLSMFNRLAGSADEMGSYVKLLKDEIEQAQDTIRERDNAVNELRDLVKQLNVAKGVREKLEAKIEALSKAENSVIRVADSPYAFPTGVYIDNSAIYPRPDFGWQVVAGPITTASITAGSLSFQSCPQCGQPFSGDFCLNCGPSVSLTVSGVKPKLPKK
jgi:putative GTP pyrophosphokinase